VCRDCKKLAARIRKIPASKQNDVKDVVIDTEPHTGTRTCRIIISFAVALCRLSDAGRLKSKAALHEAVRADEVLPPLPRERGVKEKFTADSYS